MTQYKILVVDDNADIRELLEILLTSEGYAVTLASSGEQALQLLSPELDLVILDIMMPGISGIRVCEAIRKQSNVPVLFLTAKGQDEDISLGLRVGPTTTCPSPSPMRSSPPGSRACCGATGCIRARANLRRTNGWCAGRCASTALIMR